MNNPVLAAEGVCKSYGHIRSLQGASLEVHAGEVVALIGDNGAGKSTLVKVLSGAVTPDAGQITVDGTPVEFSSPADAQARGIETVYQDLALAPDLNPVANLYLGRELRRRGLAGLLGFLDRAAMRRESRASLQQLGVGVPDLGAPVASFSGGQRQGIAVARAVMWAKRVVFMDEPTAALGVAQTGNVLRLIRTVRDEGTSVVLISHNMPDVLAVADRIQVLRLGRSVATFRAADITSDDLVRAMTGTLEQGLDQGAV